MSDKQPSPRTYTNGEITIEWRPELCMHARNCIQMLPQVYRPQERPWLRPEHASTEELIRQIECCPSGALSYRKNKE